MDLLQSSTIIELRNNSTWKDFLPLLTVIATLVLFIIDRALGARIRHREVARNWYLKVLIEPNLIKINSFFDEVSKAYNEACLVLVAKGELPVSESSSMQASIFEKFVDLQTQLRAYLIQPLSMRYATLAASISGKLDDLYDEFTTRLDNSLFSKDEQKDFSIITHQKKSEILELLYLPLG